MNFRLLLQPAKYPSIIKTVFRRGISWIFRVDLGNTASDENQIPIRDLSLFDGDSYLVDPTKPSFRAELFRQRNITANFESENGFKHPLLAISGKVEWREQIESFKFLDLKLPQIYGSYASIRDVDFDQLPDAFVIKSVHGHDSFGVFPLRRMSDTEFYDFKEARTISADEIVERYLAASNIAKGGVSENLYIEQLLNDPDRPDHPPIDWKLFITGGRVLATMCRLSIPVPGKKAWPYRFRWFDQDWNDYPGLQNKHVMEPSLPLPRHPELLKELAIKVASSFPYVVTRVDLFDLPDGVYFGEVTPNAGGDFYMPRWLDEKLGEIWQQGDRHLHAAMLKKFEELGQPVIGPELWR